MSPVTLPVAQNRPSGYLMSSWVRDWFGSSLKMRDVPHGDNDRYTGESSGSNSIGDCSTSSPGHSLTENSTQPTTSSMVPDSSGQSSSCSTSWTPSVTVASPTTTSMSATSSATTDPKSLPTSTPSSLPTASSVINGNESSAASSTQAKSHKSAIIGGIVGGVVILSIAALILFLFLRRRRRLKHTAPSAEFLHPNSPFQRLNTARSGSPTRTRSVFDMLPSDTSGRSLLRSLSWRDPPVLEKVAVDTSSAAHAL
ncbi:hypothetical protein IW262DRAFT_581334 [Armillaria fumosa]|nr:hypothetical protein IW262DRAFT_581334 [Armillaria fumosa]